MYLALLFKRRLPAVIAGVFCLLSMIPNLAFTQKKSSRLTETEARTFMEDFLDFSNFGYQTFENPQKELLTFFSPELQVIPWDLLNCQFELHMARIEKIELPWVEVIAVHPYDLGHSLNRKVRFKLGKRKGKIFIDPQIKHQWHSATITSWQEETSIEEYIGIKTLDKIDFQARILSYLSKRFAGNTKNEIDEGKLFGFWKTDSIKSVYRFRPARYEASHREEWEFREDGDFQRGYDLQRTKESDTPYYRDNSFRSRNTWWFLWKNLLVMSRDQNISILQINSLDGEKLKMRSVNKSRLDKHYVLSRGEYPDARQKAPTLLSEAGLEVVQQPIFDRIDLYQELNKTWVDRQVGLISFEGETILEAKYEDMYETSEGDKVHALFGRRWLVFDKNGNQTAVLSQEKGDELFYSGREFSYRGEDIPPKNLMIISTEDRKHGIMDSTGKIVLFPAYDYISPERYKGYRISQNRKVGFVDEEGKLVLPTIYDDFRLLDQQVILVTNGKLKGLYDIPSKAFVLEPLYESISYRRSHYSVTSAEDGNIMFLDKNYKEIKKPTENSNFYLGQGLFGLMDGFKKGLIDSSGKVILPPLYHAIHTMENGMILREKDKWGMLDKNKELVIPFEYDELFEYRRGGPFIQAKKNNKYGLLSLKGDLILAIEYDYISSSSSRQEGVPEYVLAEKSGRVGIIDLKGKEIIPFEYDNVRYISDYDQDYFSAIKGGKEGLVNADNEILLPFIFEEVRPTANPKLLQVKYEGYYGLIKNPMYSDSFSRE